MSINNYLVKIVVRGVGEEAYDIESILCDTFPNMRERFSGPKGMKRTKGLPDKIEGEFVHCFDCKKEDFCAEVRKMIYKSAGRYVIVFMKCFLIDSYDWIVSEQEEYEKLKENGELDIELDDGWEEDENEF